MPSPKLKRISWKRVFAEGEKRIRPIFVSALARAPAYERPALTSTRLHIKRQIKSALESNESKKLKHALKEQMHLLRKLKKIISA